MHRAGGKQAVYRTRFQSFDLHPLEQFFAQRLDRPGGQGGPAELAMGVGQGGLDRMQAIEPLAAGLAPPGGLSARPFRLFRGFSGRFRIEMATVLAKIPGSHAALIKKWRRR